jgi:NAD(P)-dependent dehydrogenase (short-subunit alcohol dehydrogenase family)
MSAKLNHARVLVVGGSSGIGLATAAAAAEAGAAVTIASRSQTKLESAVSTLGKTARAVGELEDMANAVMFLVTTPFATGSTVRVDGGGAIA